MSMEKEKPLPWRAFIGAVPTMLSLIMVFVLNVIIVESTGAYRSQPPANLAALVLLILGIILLYTGSRKID